MMELVLPWPSKELSPNTRNHWARRSKAAKEARKYAFLLAVSHGWRKMKIPEGRLHLWIEFHPPTRRMPDDDNMLSRFKPYRDGLADALSIDDKRFVSHPYVSEEPVKGGEVRVRMTGDTK
jgi:crossover junction endodeoxyribonuclease RusA